MVSNSILQLIVLLCLIGVICCDFEETVKTEYGTYSGHIMKARNGRDILAWKGIPFAKPPLGNLRFKDPQWLDKSEEHFEAANFSSVCYQTFRNAINPENNVKAVYYGSEDCLYLNIYKPMGLMNTGPLPVMVYIHGGAFMEGSGSIIVGPEVYLENDIIIVFINYRLSILGFFRANNDTVPGNLGLKDQTMALKWVQKNIAAFGGDPNSVTITGVSAGAISVSHHLNSKLSKGLFHRAIAQSGNSFNLISLQRRKPSEDYASRIISYLGCSQEADKLLTCLQKMPVTELFDAVDSLKVFSPNIMEIFMAPVIEDDSPTAFLTEESIREGSDVPFMTGVTSQESILFYRSLANFENGFKDLSILNKEYKRLFPLLFYYSDHPRSEEITEELRKFYFGSEEFTEKSVPNFLNLYSDLLFNHGLHTSSREYKGKLYQYRFSYGVDPSIYPESIKLVPELFEAGVSHGEDCVFLFDLSPLGIALSGKDLDMSRLYSTMMYNFSVNGEFPNDELWAESEKGVNYLDITSKGLVKKSHMFKERMEFLDILFGFAMKEHVEL